MTLYKNFIGIDIGKCDFTVVLHSDRTTTKKYENSTSGIHSFIQEFKAKLSSSFYVLENTGGYETRLLLTLCDKRYSSS